MIQISFHSIKRGLLVLIWPAFQLLGLRLILRFGFGLSYGFQGITDYDFLLPAPIGFLILMQVLDSKKIEPLTLQKKALILNLTATALFLLLNASHPWFYEKSPIDFVSLWFFLLGTIFLSSFCLFLSPQFYLRNPNRFAFLPCLLIATSLYFHRIALHHEWKWIGAFTSHSVHAFFRMIPFSQASSTFSATQELALEHPAFSARISEGCGGLDSLFLFSLVYFIVVLTREMESKPLRTSLIYLLGLVFMYVLNIVRIASLFFLGVLLVKVFPRPIGVSIFKLVFHAHLGWFLYCFGIYFYLKAWRPQKTEFRRYQFTGLISQES
jgi:exosortase/archaeosortase family protein